MADTDTSPKKEGKEKFLEQMRSLIGKEGKPNIARQPVNEVMISHWCDAMEDFNPNYLDPAYAKKGPHKEIAAPPAMLNAWAMPGLHRGESSGDPQGSIVNMLDDAGYLGVVATNSEHIYGRYMKLGDLISGSQKLVDVSPEKQTALGIGHFFTTETEYHNQDGDYLGSMFFRILKFIPGTGKTSTGKTSTGKTRGENGDGSEDRDELAPRPSVSMNANTRGFWEAAKKGELVIQSCDDCQNLQHPPAVRCLKCRSQNLGWQKVSGRGKLYSHCRVHYPRTPAFPEPPVVGLIELEEGVRIVSNITDCPPEKVQIGMDVDVWFHPGDTFLPLFRPARPARNETTLKAGDIQPGQELPLCPIPITSTQIVAGAIATRDYQDVHHDPDLARQKGSPNIFMNILSSSGLAARYVSDWAGPDAIFKNLKIRLGVPNYPHDCMVMSGHIEEKSEEKGKGEEKSGTIQVSFVGANSLGPHLTGTAELELPK